MKKLKTLLLCTIFLTSLNGQEKILWTNDIVISEDAFKDTPPNLQADDLQEFKFHTAFDFAYQMTTAQFAFTKNFNRYVEAFYIPQYSWMESGELTEDIILYSNLLFDISELYARKFRKSLYEAKKFGSSPDFFLKCYDEVQNDYVKYTSEIASKLRTSREWAEIINEYSLEVQKEIDALFEYCYSCKPQKKKKK